MQIGNLSFEYMDHKYEAHINLTITPYINTAGSDPSICSILWSLNYRKAGWKDLKRPVLLTTHCDALSYINRQFRPDTQATEQSKQLLSSLVAGL